MRLGRVFLSTKREIFKMGFWHGYTLKGRERRTLEEMELRAEVRYELEREVVVVMGVL